MSRREDIVSCINVAIMDRAANTALPSPDSKIFPAFGAGAAVTHAAGLGGKCFIYPRRPEGRRLSRVKMNRGQVPDDGLTGGCAFRARALD
jgi:hypothetical protein